MQPTKGYVFVVDDLNKKNPYAKRIDGACLLYGFHENTLSDAVKPPVFTNQIYFNKLIPITDVKDCKYLIVMPSDETAIDLYKNYLFLQKYSIKHMSHLITINKNLRWEFEADTLGHAKTIVEADGSTLDLLNRTELKNFMALIKDLSCCNTGCYSTKDFNLKSFYNFLYYSCKNQYDSLNIKQGSDYLFKTRDIVSLSSSYDYKKLYNSFATMLINNKINPALGVPMIDHVVYNAPNTVVFWKDGTSTTVSATEGEEFNKEIGLAMAISRKYFDIRGSNPRAAFKRTVENATDYTAATEHKRKQKELKTQKKLEFENGHNADI